MSQSSPSYLPRLTCNHTRHILLAIVLVAGTIIDIILAVSYPLSFSPPAPSLTSYLSCCIVQLPAVCHCESCANHDTELAIILAVSYLLLSSPPAACSSLSSTQSSCSSRRAHRVMIITSCSMRRAYRVVLNASCSMRRAHRVMLNASCRICQLSFVSVGSVVVAYIDVH